MPLPEVAREFERRTGERLTPSRVGQIERKALTKIAAAWHEQLATAEAGE